MKMKPIRFNTDMTRSLLDGNKTVTRRRIKPQPREIYHGGTLYEDDGNFIALAEGQNGRLEQIVSPYRPGDILYVQEPWTLVPDENNDPRYRLCYKADNEDRPIERWYPSVHMLREDARIFLRVTDVRVERLHDCGDMEAKEEGCTCCSHFIRVWDSTIKPAERGLYGWEANPWVWVIAFERISKEEAMRNDL